MITAVILTHNEEEVLEDALKSLEGFSNETVIIDSRSDDKTLSIAKKHKARVIENLLSSFALQRNLGAEHAHGDWIFYLDADERLTSEFKKEAISRIKSYNPEGSIAGFFIRRKTYYFGRDWGFTDRVQRLFYKKKFNQWDGVVHETPRVEGDFETISSPILHFTHRNLSQMVEKTNKWSNFEAELRYKSNHPEMSWWRFPRVMVSGFLKSYIKDKGYKNGTKGFIESMYQAFSMFITYAKLWELQKGKRG